MEGTDERAEESVHWDGTVRINGGLFGGSCHRGKKNGCGGWGWCTAEGWPKQVTFILHFYWVCPWARHLTLPTVPVISSRISGFHWVSLWGNLCIKALVRISDCCLRRKWMKVEDSIFFTDNWHCDQFSLSMIGNKSMKTNIQTNTGCFTVCTGSRWFLSPNYSPTQGLYNGSEMLFRCFKGSIWIEPHTCVWLQSYFLCLYSCPVNFLPSVFGSFCSTSKINLVNL